jgi:O-antigen/teichoic acid export membrane protein
MDEREVRSRSTRGTVWSLGGQVASFVLLLAGEAARGRLLSPSEIGLFTMAIVFTGLVDYLGELGLGAEIVRRRDLSAARIAAVHRTVLVASVVLGLVGVALAPAIGAWYGASSVVPIAAVLSWAFFLQAPGVVPRALLTRDMAFAELVRIDLAVAAMNVAVMASLAAVGAGAWALVAGLLASLIARTALIRWTRPFRPEPPEWEDFRELLVEGSRISGSRALFYAQEMVDRFFFGRAAGESALGLYSRATTLAMLPSGRIAGAFNQIAYAGFAALTEDPPALRRHYLHTLRMIALVALPASVGTAAVAGDAIAAIYGPRWLDATPVLQAASAVALTRSIKVVAPALFIARGQARYNLWISVSQVAVHAVAFAIGAGYGLSGMALVWLVAIVPLDLVVLALANRAVGVTPGDLGRALGGPALRAAGMGVAVLAVGAAIPAAREGFDPSVWAIVRLVAQVGVGGAVYGAWTLIVEPGLRARAVALLRRFTGA